MLPPRSSYFNSIGQQKAADVDVFMVDVIWQGIAAPHAVDLKKYFKDDEIKAVLSAHH